MTTALENGRRGLSEAAAPPVTRRRRSPQRRNVILTVALLACCCYFLLPLVWLVISSTKTNSELFSSFGFAFGGHFNFFANVKDVFTFEGGVFWRWIGNTVFYAGTSAIGAAALATAAGYAFAVYRFPGGRFLFSAILGAVMVPATALAIPTYLLFSSVHLTNTPLAVILPSFVNPFGVYLMRVYAADAIPDSLIEAARIDGAGEFRIFFQVCLRLLTPGMVTVFLFSLVATWNNYFLPLIMLSSSNEFPLTVGLAQWQALATGGAGGGNQPLYAMVVTGSFISIVPLVVAFLYLQRYWQTGLATGSVKA